MNTQKLYYIDSYQKECEAKVLSCAPHHDKFCIVLDQTVFYPEGGGQPSDTGTIDSAKVSHVFEKDTILYHVVDKPFEIHSTVHCMVNFKKRFAYMQLHSAEHIVSGIINKVYDLNNFGFHMDEHTATIDVDGELNKEQLLNIENLSNEEIYSNNSFICEYPSKEQLDTINYRFKKELSGDIRIVFAGKADICACCGTHVKSTGEIGLIKVLSSQKHRGGTRIVLSCGNSAFKLFQSLYEDITEISQMTSSKPVDILSTFTKITNDLQEEKNKNYNLQLKLINILLQTEPDSPTYILKVNNDLDAKSLREYALGLCSKTPTFAIALSGEENNYKYVLTSDKIDVSPINNELKSKLQSKGGGKADLCQGTIPANLVEIQALITAIGGK